MNEFAIAFFRSNKSWSLYSKLYINLHHTQKEKVNSELIKEGIFQRGMIK